jgi:probable phosphoglycerate mutase
VALNATGRAQAEAAAERLRHRGIATIVSSPLSRARVTAETVGRTLGLEVQFDQDLQEVNFGEQEGRPMGNWYDDWIAGAYTPKGAETFAELRARATAALNRCITKAPAVLVVAHGGFFRAVRAEMGLVPNVRTPNATPLFCEPGSPAWTLTPAA